MSNKFRKKPVVIEAIQYNGPYSIDEMCEEWWEPFITAHVYINGILKIKTLEGDHYASIGDWIIKGVANEFYPCKPEVFEKTYEKVD